VRIFIGFLYMPNEHIPLISFSYECFISPQSLIQLWHYLSDVKVGIEHGTLRDKLQDSESFLSSFQQDSGALFRLRLKLSWIMIRWYGLWEMFS